MIMVKSGQVEKGCELLKDFNMFLINMYIHTADLGGCGCWGSWGSSGGVGALAELGMGIFNLILTCLRPYLDGQPKCTEEHAYSSTRFFIFLKHENNSISVSLFSLGSPEIK